MLDYHFTSESVSRGHPDKVADQISDRILTYCAQKGNVDLHFSPRCAVETMVKNNNIFIAGEVSESISDEVLRKLTQEVYEDIGYSFEGIKVHNYLDMQSSEIANSVNKVATIGAGDQGMMFGYANKDTEALMPAPIFYAQKLMKAYHQFQKNSGGKFMPDAKTQLTFHYQNGKPVFIDTVVLSAQHSANLTHDDIELHIKSLINSVIPADFLTEKTKYHINPSGSFVIGGPFADAGLTGRKIIVDSYGGFARHGGGAFSGKDATKVDRSGAYIARFMAKHVVGLGVADSCEIEISYAIGVSEPVSIYVRLGNGKVAESAVINAIRKTFDLTPLGIYNALDLANNAHIYYQTAQFGHFGHEFPWEKLTMLEELSANL